MDSPEFPTREAIDKLVTILNLPAPDLYEQDWEFVVSDAEHIQEFIDCYKTANLNDIEKFTLMIIIIGSFDDALAGNSFDEKLWMLVCNLLFKDSKLHSNTIDYWSSEEDKDIEDCFYITPFIREIRKLINERGSFTL